MLFDAGRMLVDVTVLLDRARVVGAPRILITDALAQGVAASDVERTVEVSHTLTTLRQQLGF